MIYRWIIQYVFQLWWMYFYFDPRTMFFKYRYKTAKRSIKSVKVTRPTLITLENFDLDAYSSSCMTLRKHWFIRFFISRKFFAAYEYIFSNRGIIFSGKQFPSKIAYKDRLCKLHWFYVIHILFMQIKQCLSASKDWSFWKSNNIGIIPQF